MEENNESTEFLGKMAMISEACQEVFKGKTSIAVELNDDEFINVFLKFNPDFTKDNKEQFSVDISGTEFFFILDK
jgi:hypothetical protein